MVCGNKMGVFTKIFGKRKLEPSDIEELLKKLDLLFEECHSAEYIKDSLNYGYLLYSKTNDIFENTDYETSFSVLEKEGLYFLYFASVAEIISGLTEFKESSFEGINIDKYIEKGLKTVNKYIDEYNSNTVTKDFVGSLLHFLRATKRYYEKTNNHERAIEMSAMIKEYEPLYSIRNKKYKDRKSFDEKVDEKKKIKTKRGELVQSVGEQQIADYLTDKDIDYNYDKQITLSFNEPNKNGHKQEWVRPDFYLNEFNIIIEYWGMKGDSDYDNKKDWKERVYAESKTKYISIYKEDLADLEAKLETKLKRLGVNL